jgi:hypothetical protein
MEVFELGGPARRNEDLLDEHSHDLLGEHSHDDQFLCVWTDMILYIESDLFNDENTHTVFSILIVAMVANLHFSTSLVLLSSNVSSQ